MVNWTAEVEAVIRNLPQGCVVRVREGGGPEDLAATLAVSVSKLVSRVKELEEELEDSENFISAIIDATGGTLPQGVKRG